MQHDKYSSWTKLKILQKKVEKTISSEEFREIFREGDSQTRS